MNSFYGGKQGRTYHIVQHYDSVYNMASSFHLGADYKDVKYGQYVIIDTAYKGNPQNGLLYRRGLNSSAQVASTIDYDDISLSSSTVKNYWNNPGGGAEYVGQIVGPQGKSPEIWIEPWDENISPTSSGYAGINLATTKAEDNQIKICSTTIKDSVNNVEGAKLYFKFPSPVFDFSEVTFDANVGATLGASVNSTAPFYNVMSGNIPSGNGIENMASIPKERNITNSSFGSTTYKKGDLYYLGNDNQFAVCIQEGTANSSITPKGGSGSNTFQPGYVTESGQTLWVSQYLSSIPAMAQLATTYTNTTSSFFDTRLLDNLFIDNNNRLYACYSDEGEAQYISTLEFPKEYHVQGQYILPSLLASTINANSLASNFTWIGDGFDNAIYYGASSSASTALTNLTGERGWLISVKVTNSQTDEDEYRFYAFDYTRRKINSPYSININGSNYNTYWVQIGNIGANVVDPKYIIDVGSMIDNDYNLNNDGINFDLSLGHHYHS